MGRLLVFVLVLAAAWYGWRHWDELRGGPADEVVLVNRSGIALERVRLSAGDFTVVAEMLEDGATARYDWHGRQDAVFSAVWNLHGRDGERTWTGGGYHASPDRERATFEFTPDGRVVWRSEVLARAEAPSP